MTTANAITWPMPYSLTVSAGPAAEPLTTAEAKLFARVDISTDDTLVDIMVSAARDRLERETGRVFRNTTFVQKFSGHSPGGDIVLARGPVSSVTSVQYVDGAGSTQPAAASVYDAILGRDPARIVLAHGQSWTTPRQQEESVIVTYVAGYGTNNTAIPKSYLMALYQQFAHDYTHRDQPDVPRPEAIDRTVELWRIW